MEMSGRTPDTVCVTDDVSSLWTRVCRGLARELPVWRDFAFTSIVTVVFWWLAVAFCVGDGLENGEFSHLPSLAHAGLSQPIGDSIGDSIGAYEPVVPDHPSLTPGQVFSEPDSCFSNCNEWLLLPDGLLYDTYLAGPKEPRLQWVMMHDSHNNTNIWEATLGGRVGLLRYGTHGAKNPQGFQLDLDGAVFARVLPDEPSSMLAASDYRVGVFGTWRHNRVAWKAGYYHISSHIGDEFLIANPMYPRMNYVRDSLVVGTSYDMAQNTRIYGEIGNAVGHQGGAKPLEFQFGAEYTPKARSAFRGAPFAAVNNSIREDFDWINGVNVVGGWGWEGPDSSRRVRIGMQYYNGPSLQYSFLNRQENLFGGGIWLDY